MEKWKRLLQNSDPKHIWKSVNWKGKLDMREVKQPSDEQFKGHFENLLNPVNNETLNNNNKEEDE